MPDRALPVQARILRLVFFSTYWTAIACLCGSLAFAVIGSQVRFWSRPRGLAVERNERICRERIAALARELDASQANALSLAERAPREALPSFRRFGESWNRRWRDAWFGCGLDDAAAERASLATSADALLDHRWAVESLVRRYAASEGAARARIAVALPGSRP